MIKVSVIVPVYNIKDCLEKCIQSIQRQTYGNIEILLVNDGSTDGSDIICRKYARIDRRIEVIDKENGGLVSARKAGISRAEGDYILNVDGDDWIEDIMIESLVLKAEQTNADIVTSGYYQESLKNIAKVTDSIEEGIYYTDEEKNYFYQRMIFNGKVERKGIMQSICTKLIRASLFREVYLRESEYIVLGEDTASLYSCCVQADKIMVTHDAYYHYVKRLSSITHTKDKFFLRNVNEVYLFMSYFFEKSKYKKVLCEQLDLLIMQYCLWGINYMFDMTPKILMPYYNFPAEGFLNGKKIIIYGAGKVGQSYYKQFQADTSCKVAGWVDQRFEHYREKGYPVNSIEIVGKLEYDYIILAFKYKDMAEQVKELLISEYGIYESKFIWKEPVSVLDKYWME